MNGWVYEHAWYICLRQHFGSMKDLDGSGFAMLLVLKDSLNSGEMQKQDFDQSSAPFPGIFDLFLALSGLTSFGLKSVQ